MIRSIRQLPVQPLNDKLSPNKLELSIDDSSDTLALILAGGRGSRLSPLTDSCCKPAVPFGGNFRIIDFALSNCINSRIRRIGVLSQYEQKTLIQHLYDGWNILNREMNEFIDLIPACQRNGKSWYQGTADAVRQNLDAIREISPKYTLILAGDHVYKADYRRMIDFHECTEASITVACTAVPRLTARQLGVLCTDARGRIRSFQEKPSDPIPMHDQPSHCLASMGIYVFNTNTLIDLLEADASDVTSSHDFGRDILPKNIETQCVMAYDFSKSQSENYWRDVGTVDAYFETNMQLLDANPVLDLHDSSWPIRSLPLRFPAARFISDDNDICGTASDSIVAAGCVLRGARVRRAILFENVEVEKLTQIRNVLVLPNAKIGKGCRIQNAIIGSNCYIPEGTVIGYDRIEDAKRYQISNKGIVVVTASDDHVPLNSVHKLQQRAVNDSEVLVKTHAT